MSGERVWPGVSAVVPVLNEERHLAEAVSGILAQDYPGDLEVVLALGPSTDGTDAVAAGLAAKDPRIRTVPNPSGRTPAALNAAIRAARYPVLVRVDGHGVLSPAYLRIVVELLASTGADNVGGVMAAEGTTDFERAVARAMTSRLGVGGGRFHTGGAEGPVDTVYLGAFRRETLERLGGYDEAFLRTQDWELNHRIRAAGGTVWFSPRLRVAYRPRGSLRALGRQFWEYGRWRRAVLRRHGAGTASVRYLAPPAAVVGLAAAVAVSPWLPVALVVPAGYAGALVVGSLVEGRDLPPRALVALPAVLATMHLAWGWGFLTSPRHLLGPPQVADLSRTAAP